MSFLRFLSFPQLAVAIALHLFATPGTFFFLLSMCSLSVWISLQEMMAWIRLSWSVLACLTYVNINAWKSSSRLNIYSRHGCNSISPVSCFARETWHIYNMAMFGWWFIIVRRTRRENLIVHRRDRQNGIRNVQWTWTTHTQIDSESAIRNIATQLISLYSEFGKKEISCIARCCRMNIVIV